MEPVTVGVQDYTFRSVLPIFHYEAGGKIYVFINTQGFLNEKQVWTQLMHRLPSPTRLWKNGHLVSPNLLHDAL